MGRSLAHVLPLALLLTACSGPSSECGPSNCDGCCDASGECQAGLSPLECGTAGSVCTPCPGDQTCNFGVCVTPTPACTPKTCASLGKNCGQVQDGCGGVLECGSCMSGETCGGAGVANECGPGTCEPKTCEGLQAECGAVSDGCASVLTCGSCGPNATCGTEAPNKCACRPTTCAEAGKNCGSIPDGCGGTVSCGACSQPGFTCGGGGTPNVCEEGSCTPTTCTALGKDCGQVSDGCGGTLECGTCALGTCGGRGTPNVCGAECTTSCPGGFACNTYGQCSGGDLQNVVLDEVGHLVSGKVTVGGKAPTKNLIYCNQSSNLEDLIAVLSFTEPTKGYSGAYPFRCSSSDWSWNLLLPAGTYDFSLSPGPYATSAGVNLLGVPYIVATGVVVNGPVSNLLFDEVGHTVSGAVTVNGKAPTKNAAYCSQSGNLNDSIGELTFKERTRGYTGTYTFRCSAADWSWNLTLPAGTYDFRLRPGTYATSAGVNLLPVDYLIASGVVVSGPLQGLGFNEVGHLVAGSVTVNGAPPTKSATYCTQSGNLNDNIGELSFTERSKGYSGTYYFRCNAPDWGFNLELPEGTYDFRLGHGTYSTSAGVNLLPVTSLVATNVVINGPVSNLALNEVGHAVSGAVTVNGAPPTKDATYCSQPGNLNDSIGVLSFYERTKGYAGSSVFRCNAPDWTFKVLLPPGTWEFRVGQGSYSASAGVNLLPVDYLAATDVVVNGPVSNLVFNEVGHAVSGVVTVNGAAPTKSASYCTQSANLNDLIGEVTFRDDAKGYAGSYSFRCNSPDWKWSVLLPSGTYDVRVKQGSYSASAGVNLLPVDYVAAKALVVNGPMSNLTLNEVGRKVAGTVTVNGKQPTKSASYCAQSGNLNDIIGDLWFHEPSLGYVASHPFRCSAADWSWNLLLAPGTYDLRIRQGPYSINAGVNLLPVDYLAVERLVVP